MKKLKYLIAALLLTACLVGSASAVTPAYKPPKLPVRRQNRGKRSHVEVFFRLF